MTRCGEMEFSLAIPKSVIGNLVPSPTSPNVIMGRLQIFTRTLANNIFSGIVIENNGRDDKLHLLVYAYAAQPGEVSSASLDNFLPTPPPDSTILKAVDILQEQCIYVQTAYHPHGSDNKEEKGVQTDPVGIVEQPKISRSLGNKVAAPGKNQKVKNSKEKSVEQGGSVVTQKISKQSKGNRNKNSSAGEAGKSKGDVQVKEEPESEWNQNRSADQITAANAILSLSKQAAITALDSKEEAMCTLESTLGKIQSPCAGTKSSKRSRRKNATPQKLDGAVEKEGKKKKVPTATLR